MSSKTLVAMKKVDGEADSEIHFEGHIAKPDETGVVLIHAEHALSLLGAGYFYVLPND